MLTFRHAGDGNIHLIATTRNNEDKQRVDKTVYRIARNSHSSITAEYGVSMLKRPWLSLSRSVEKIALMRGLKTTLDPNGLLNQGRVI